MRRIVRRLRKDADEVDACSRWRRYYAGLSRPGVRAYIKRKIRRRERREAKEEIRHESENEL